MINHAFACFYAKAAQTQSGVYNPLSSDLSLGDVLTTGLAGVRGSTAASAEAFAIRALKVIAGSTFAASITAKDPRLTYELHELGVNDEESMGFLTSIVGLPGAVISLATSYEDIRGTFSTSRILPERAAAVLVGILRKIEELNGL